MKPTRTHTLKWCADPDFNGLRTTYIHWLYNGNLPTAAVDVSDKRKVGDVLAGLAEEYNIGAWVRDRRYMDDIMDAFITIQVRTRWLALLPVVKTVYDTTVEVSMLRVMLADLFAFILVDKNEKFDFDILEDMPQAFNVNVLVSMVMLKPNEVNEWYWYLKDTGKTYYV